MRSRKIYEEVGIWVLRKPRVKHLGVFYKLLIRSCENACNKKNYPVKGFFQFLGKDSSLNSGFSMEVFINASKVFTETC